MAQLEFLENETIEVMDTQAWIISNNQRIEVQLIVTNLRFLAVKETQSHEKKVVLSLNMDDIKRIESKGETTLCFNKENQVVEFESKPIGLYLSKKII